MGDDLISRAAHVLVFDPGHLRVAADGSGYFCVPDADMVFEDDRDEGPDGPDGSIHWIARMDASEIHALRDFLNSAIPAPAVAWTGSGSMAELRKGRGGFMWPEKDDPHPIPLYSHPSDAESLRGEVERLREQVRMTSWMGEGYAVLQLRAEKAEAACDAAMARVAELEADRQFPPLDWRDGGDDEAMEWVTKHLMAIRRDNGNMDYSLLGVVRAYQAGKSAALTPPPDAELDALASEDLPTPYSCQSCGHTEDVVPGPGAICPECNQPVADLRCQQNGLVEGTSGNGFCQACAQPDGHPHMMDCPHG